MKAIKLVWRGVLCFFFKRKQLYALSREISELYLKSREVLNEDSPGGRGVTKEEAMSLIKESEDVLGSLRKLLI